MVGRLLRERREAKGWSQERLAEAIGTSQRQVTRWEHYTTEMPREATRERIGQWLGITPAEWHLAAAAAVSEDRVIAEAPAPYLSDAALLTKLGAEPVYDDAPMIDEFTASARNGLGNLIPQNYDDMRPRPKPRKKREEPVIFKLRISGHCLTPDVRNGEIVLFDTRLPREPVVIVLAAKDEHIAYIKRLVRRGDRLWLESNDGWEAQVDAGWRILAVAYSAQRGLL